MIMRRRTETALLLLLLPCFGGCELSTDADSVSTDAAVQLVGPDITSAVRSGGKFYLITRTDKPDESREYDYQTSFTITVAETNGVRVYIKGVGIKVQQAFGGIVAPPTTGDVEHYEFVSRPSSNQVEGRGNATVQFDVWYDLPNLGREALVTVTFTILDKQEADDAEDSDDNDDLNDITFSKSIDVRIQ